MKNDKKNLKVSKQGDYLETYEVQILKVPTKGAYGSLGKTQEVKIKRRNKNDN